MSTLDAEALGALIGLARAAGLNNRIQPTPAVALGAYEVTPVEIAGAYTMFANRGIHADPFFLPGLQDITSHVDFSAMAWAVGFDAQGSPVSNPKG